MSKAKRYRQSVLLSSLPELLFDVRDAQRRLDRVLEAVVSHCDPESLVHHEVLGRIRGHED
jgi:hypothetical protein